LEGRVGFGSYHLISGEAIMRHCLFSHGRFVASLATTAVLSFAMHAQPVQAVTFFTENFSNTGALPGPNLEQSVLNTAATFNGSVATFPGGGDNGRSYLRTIDDDYVSGNFAAEITTTLNNGGGGGSAFFGLGVGDPFAAFFHEPRTSPSIFARLQPSDFGGGGAVTTDNAVEVTSPGGGVAGNGTHRVRMEYDAAKQLIVFYIDKNYAGGPFVADSVLGVRNAADNGLNATNARVFFGSSSNVTFDDLSVTSFGGFVAGDLPAPIAGAFSVREVRQSGFQINNISDANALLNLAGAGFLPATDGFSSTINFIDPDNTGGGGQDGTGNNFLSDSAGDDQDFAQFARGFVKIENAGTYTFFTRGDDGFSLRLIGDTWDSVTDNGDGTTTILGDLMENPGTGGNVNGFGVVTLDAGVYELQYTFFERAGGAYNELWAAQGTHTIFNTNAFRLVGDVNAGGLELVAAPSSNGTIPEPATAMLGMIGVALMGLRRRRLA